MSKTKKIILIFFGVILVGILALWYLNKQNTNDTLVDNKGFSVRNFFPFGNSDEIIINNDEDDQTNDTQNNSNQSTTTSTNIPIVKLRKLSDNQVSGAIIFNKSTTSVVRFVERSTGNVYEARSDVNTLVRLTNETIPKISRAIWLKDGSGFLAQNSDSKDNILTSFVKLKQASTSKETVPFTTSISNLPTGTQGITISPDNKKVFYYINTDKTYGYVSNVDGTNPFLVFSSYINEWIPQWVNGDIVNLSTKASIGSLSYGFVLSINNKKLTRTYSAIYGVSSLMSINGKNLIIGEGSRSISLFNISDSNISNINIKTLPEKCVWDTADNKFVFCGIPKVTPPANYPDDWYKGILSTNDLIQRINVFDNYTYILSDPNKEVGEDIDVENIQSSGDGSYLIFTNKKDSSLWLLSVN